MRMHSAAPSYPSPCCPRCGRRFDPFRCSGDLYWSTDRAASFARKVTHARWLAEHHCQGEATD